MSRFADDHRGNFQRPTNKKVLKNRNSTEEGKKKMLKVVRKAVSVLGIRITVNTVEAVQHIKRSEEEKKKKEGREWMMRWNKRRGRERNE